jgi:7-cyano-7-deazaguanine reductase
MDNTNISKHLGKTSEYKAVYDSSLLVREPRSSNRVHLEIDDNDLPFVGFDTWNAYEVSCLLQNGTPIAVVAKIVYDCKSKYIVESKSLKLYLNTFNMTKLNVVDTKAACQELQDTIQADLSNLLEINVSVSIATNREVFRNSINSNAFATWKLDKYVTLEENARVECDVFFETPSLLKYIQEPVSEGRYLHSSLLKSNCRVTQQPDWGDVFIYYKSDKEVTKVSLLQYIVSFRDECHFHEEICETIFKRLQQVLNPEELLVKCLYARRGGIDINPQRATSVELLDKDLYDANIIHIKTPKQ